MTTQSEKLEARELVFTPEQVRHINEFQRAGFMHPFTCGNNHEGERELVATIYGLICPCCDYTQDWVHDFMANGDAVENGRKLRAARPLSMTGEMRDAVARAVSEAGGAANWEHAIEVAEATIAAIQEQSK